jgi:hypothetical protein
MRAWYASLGYRGVVFLSFPNDRAEKVKYREGLEENLLKIFLLPIVSSLPSRYFPICLSAESRSIAAAWSEAKGSDTRLGTLG